MTEDILGEVRRNGFVVLREHLRGEELDELQRAAESFVSGQRPWYQLTIGPHTRLATIAPQRVPEGEQDRVRPFVRTFTRPAFMDTTLAYLGADAYVDRIIVHREEAHPQPVTEWHADQQRDGRLSLKFMLYFNDVDARNGAFSYVPGSHRVVRALTREALARGQRPGDVHNFEQMRSFAREVGMTEAVNLLDSLTRHIRGDYESDDAYSLAAPPGSVIMFDTKGIHRGGVVRAGHRFLMRVHCFQSPAVSWRQRIKQLIQLQGRRERFFAVGAAGAGRQETEEYG